MMKCPSCGKEMYQEKDNEINLEKKFFCFDCEIKIMVLPNGIIIIKELCESWESESEKNVS